MSAYVPLTWLHLFSVASNVKTGIFLQCRCYFRLYLVWIGGKMNWGCRSERLLHQSPDQWNPSMLFGWIPAPDVKTMFKSRSLRFLLPLFLCFSPTAPLPPPIKSALCAELSFSVMCRIRKQPVNGPPHPTGVHSTPDITSSVCLNKNPKEMHRVYVLHHCTNNNRKVEP